MPHTNKFQNRFTSPHKLRIVASKKLTSGFKITVTKLRFCFTQTIQKMTKSRFKVLDSRLKLANAKTNRRLLFHWKVKKLPIALCLKTQHGCYCCTHIPSILLHAFFFSHTSSKRNLRRHWFSDVVYVWHIQPISFCVILSI
jgi:hypothetical protein